MYKIISNALLLAGLLWIIAARILVPDASIQPDSPRYASAGLNIFDYGVLSAQGYQENQVPLPGLYAGGLFTALEIALAAAANSETYDDLVCVAKVSVDDVCGQGLWSLKIIYYLETVIFHLAVLYVGYLFFNRSLFAGWIVLACSLAFQETFEYASSPLSEQGYLMTSGLFAAAWARACDRRTDVSSWAIAGVFAGLVVWVKPAWMLLPIGLFVIPIFSVARDRSLAILVLKAAAAFLIAFLLTLLPIFMRNWLVLGLFALGEPSYLVSSLSHRFAFNLMSWREWLIGWIYYLPLSGARMLFGTDALAPLGWGDVSYYQYGRDVLDAIAREGRSIAEAKSYLLDNFVFATPVKFLAVTLLLLWRGLFVGHLVGMLAVPLGMWFLLGANGAFFRRWLFLFVPAFFMAGVHATVSVSIYRYNIPLIIPYCLAMAWCGFFTLNFAFQRVGHDGFLATASRFLPATR